MTYKIDFTTGIWTEEIARVILNADSGSIEAVGLPSRKYIKVLLYSPGTSADITTFNFRVNNSFANYGGHIIKFGGTYTRSSLAPSGAAVMNNDTFWPARLRSEVEVVDQPNVNVKLITGKTTTLFGTTPTNWNAIDNIGSYNWQAPNSSDRINRVQFAVAGGQLRAGTELIVLAHD